MFWKLIALILSNRFLSGVIIRRAKRTPYVHLDGYMNRWWLFNAYQDTAGNNLPQNWLMRRLPSVRVHHILREDMDRHMHDHPWDARTIILRGVYVEEYLNARNETIVASRMNGDTRAIRFGEYHRIKYVGDGGVYTLFFTWKYVGTWGFLVNGHKVPYREYLGIDG